METNEERSARPRGDLCGIQSVTIAETGESFLNRASERFWRACAALESAAFPWDAAVAVFRFARSKSSAAHGANAGQ